MPWADGRLPASRRSSPGLPSRSANGSDRNNDGIPADRPDIGNPSAPLNSRAIIAPRCATGYQNPDTGSCVSPGDVHWVEGTGFPNASTVGPQYAADRRHEQLRSEPVEVDSVGREAAAGVSLGSAERIQSSAVCPGPANERKWHSGGALPESRFHRQRHPQHVGAGEAGVLTWIAAPTAQHDHCQRAVAGLPN